MGGCVSKKPMTSTENIIKANVANQSRNNSNQTNTHHQQSVNVNILIKLLTE